jgi:two-component system sensor histidine kinase KdpD
MSASASNLGADGGAGTGLALREYAGAVLLLSIAALACLGFRSRLNPTDIAMVLLLADVIVASRFRRGPALVVAGLSIAVFDFAFIPPYYTFAVHEASYVITFGVMLVVAVIMTRVMGRVREQAREARQREQRTALLYRLSQQLGSASGADGVLAVVVRSLGEVMGAQPVVILSPGQTPVEKWPSQEPFQSLEVRVAASWVLESGQAAGRGTRHCTEAEALILPLRTPVRMMGVVALPIRSSESLPEQAQVQTLQALADEGALALERTFLAQEHETVRAEVEAERLRTSLLSSLSHDLRSPLGSIEGAASMLVGDGVFSPEVRRDLAASILHESRRMTRLIANLLDMIRVETGALAVRKEWQPLEEVLGVALIRLEDKLRSHPVHLEIPDELPLVPVDELLLEQVFINLLENAAKHTPPGTPVSITAWTEQDAVVVEVADRGPGISASEEETVFRKFYRGTGQEKGDGAGLGLTICRGIVTAHGGTIWAEAAPAGGVRFRFTLPLSGPPMSPLPTPGPEREP